MADAVPCPERDDLQRFLMGRLAEADALPLQEHLAKCSSCLDTLHSLEADDTLIAAVRAQQQVAERSEDAIVEGLVAHLSGLHPAVKAASPTVAPGAGPDCGFLAPANDAGEIGWLGGYRVLKVLGAGGMGIVFEAEDPRLKRRVALKVMKPALAANESARLRFQREAEAIAALEHDHIVAIHQVGEDRGVPFLAMPLLKGESLQDRLDREGTLPNAEVLRIGREIAAGLAAAHERGLVHRDVKPANVWLEGTTGRVKLLDFGLARPMVENSHLTQEGVVAGTPHYMAPEQATGKPVDHRCDLFSLGCVLYRMATGTLPFPGANMLEVLQSLATTTPNPVSSYNTKIPAPLNALILKLLARSPEQRPASAQVVQEAIVTIERPPAPAPHRMRPLVAAAAAFLTLGFVVAAVSCGPAVYRFATNQGQLIIETSDPDVTVIVKQNGEKVRVLDTKSGGEIALNLKAGSYQIELANGKQGLKISPPEFTLERNGEQIVKVWFEPKPMVKPNVPDQTKELAPFVLLASGSPAEQTFPTLVAVVAAAKSGDVIEIRGNGPFETPALHFGKRDLVIRAGAGFEPVLQVDATSLAANKPMLASLGTLTLEGLHFRHVEDQAMKLSYYTLIHCRGPLAVTHCRFFVKSKRDVHALGAEGSPRVEVRHCEFAGAFNNAMTWILPAAGQMEVSDCLCWGSHGFVYYAQNQPVVPREIAVRLNRNTFLGYRTVLHHNHVPLEPPANPDLRPIRIDARENIFDADGIFIFQFTDTGKFDAEATRPLLPRYLVWNERKNLYTVANNWVSVGQYDKRTITHIKDLKEWSSYWGVADTGSLHERPRYAGGDIWAAKSDKRTPAEFRLHKDSPGKGAGEGGRDLGADVDQVGPGKAYEQWKKTPAYTTWLAATGQTPPFVVLSARKTERKFATLTDAAAAAESGDTIEIRGNGPYVTPAIDLGNRDIVIRAGAGFEPVLQIDANSLDANKPLLASKGALSLEGLHFRHVEDRAPKNSTYNLIHVQDHMSVTHCRFFVKSTRDLNVLLANQSSRAEIRHCEFAGAFNAAIAWSLPAAGQMTVVNCLCWGGNHFIYTAEYPPAVLREIAVRVHGNTFVGNRAIIHHYRLLPEAAANPDMKPFRIDARENVVDADGVFSFVQADSKEFKLDVVRPLLPRFLAWTEAKNAYTGPNLLWIGQHAREHSSVAKRLDEWKTYWGLADMSSRQAERMRFQGGDVRATKAKTPEELSANDFRLHKDSDGKGAGENGRDLGVDVDQIGPGRAYERWKRTPAYETWLATSGQITPFVVLSVDKTERKFSSLADATNAARSGEVVEIRGNGPYVSQWISIPDRRALVIRAAAGFEPILQPDGQDFKNNTSLLTTKGPLILEGLHFRYMEDPARTQGYYVFIRSNDSPLSITHCRFFLKSARNSAVINTEKCPRLQVRHCEFAGNFNMAISWGQPLTSFHKLELTDNLCWGAGAFVNYHHLKDTLRDADLRMARNTFVGDIVVAQQHQKLFEPPANPDLRPIRIDARENVLDANAVIRLVPEDKFQPEIDQPLLPRLMAWSESKNRYTNPVLKYVKFGGKPSRDYFQSLKEWQTYWRVQDTSSEHSKRLLFQGGDVRAKKAAAPEKLTAADFRLHPASDGKGEGENGRDLGADVDKVGPGKAYAEWLKSPAYKQWLAATGRDPEPFVVMPADRKKEFKYETLKDAVESAFAGDIIEVRGNGPYVSEPITITGKALTLRAGNGFAPVIQLSPAGIKAVATLLETNAPLTIEGLELQRLSTDDAPAGQPRTLLVSRRSPLFVSHCRFLMNGLESRYTVLALESPALEVRNSFLNGEFIHALYWLRPPGGRMMVKNNVIRAGHLGLSIQQFGFDSGEASIRLDGNTFMANFTLQYYFDETDAPRKAGVAPMPLTATDNVFQSLRVVSFIRHKKYVPVDFKGAEARLRELLVWQDRRNLYGVPEEYLWYKAFAPVPPEAKGPKNLDEWTDFWKAKDTGSRAGFPRYQANVLNKWELKRPEELRPEDFRLQPGSHGQGAGENGRDLGADVDMVGPGPAYDYWRRTPEYQEWLKTTGQRR